MMGEIRIVGRKDVLEQAVLVNGGPVAGVSDETANTYVIEVAL
jgi:hypothetical protein